MAYKVRITPFANNAAKKLNPKAKKAAKTALKELTKNPYLGKKLQAELSGFFSYKFLRYRIIYKAEASEKVIIVWGIGHRRDIYESLGEHLLNAAH